MDHNKLWKALKEMGILDHLFLSPEKPQWQVKKLDPGMEQLTGSFEKGVKTTYFHPVNLYTEHIMKNAGLNEVQAGIKIARRNINSLRYADDATLMHSGTKESLDKSERRE